MLAVLSQISQKKKKKLPANERKYNENKVIQKNKRKSYAHFFLD